MLISAIVACANHRIIGKDNQMPWYLPVDLAYFKRTTLDHHVIMGRNSLVSMGRPLPKRTNIVVTRDPFFIASGCVIAHSIAEAVQIAEQNGETEAFILGGGEIFRQSVDLWDRLYLTEIDLDTEGDVFFPELDWSTWRLVSEQKHEKDDKNAFDCIFKLFEREVPKI